MDTNNNGFKFLKLWTFLLLIFSLALIAGCVRHAYEGQKLPNAEVAWLLENIKYYTSSVEHSQNLMEAIFHFNLLTLYSTSTKAGKAGKYL